MKTPSPSASKYLYFKKPLGNSYYTYRFSSSRPSTEGVTRLFTFSSSQPYIIYDIIDCSFCQISKAYKHWVFQKLKKKYFGNFYQENNLDFYFRFCSSRTYVRCL